MRTAFLVCVYPCARSFLVECFTSIANQTDDQFDLLIANDGVEDLVSFLSKSSMPTSRCLSREFSGAPVVIRRQAIRWALDLGYEALIFGDADDWFEPSRVQVTKEVLAHADCVFHDQMLFGDGMGGRTRSMLGGIFHDGEVIREKSIWKGNCLGLSNTAVRSSLLRDQMAALMKVPDTSNAFDWDLFSLLLHSRAGATFTARTQTHYRQQRGPASSFGNPDEAAILAGVIVKRSHYRLLESCSRGHARLADDFDALWSELQQSRAFRSHYIAQAIARSGTTRLWWEHIVSPTGADLP